MHPLYSHTSGILSQKLICSFALKQLRRHPFHQHGLFYTFAIVHRGHSYRNNSRCVWAKPLPSSLGDRDFARSLESKRYVSVNSVNLPAARPDDRPMRDRIAVYCRLMRYQALTPVAIFCYPAMWSAFMALPPVFGLEEMKKMALFCLGAFFARTAGCCVNDLADRNIDRHVERTKTRPLAAGQISTTSAVAIMSVNASLGLAVLMQFDLNTIRLGILTALGACCYPFMKRFTNYPQVFLGLASNISVFIVGSFFVTFLSLQRPGRRLCNLSPSPQFSFIRHPLFGLSCTTPCTPTKIRSMTGRSALNRWLYYGKGDATKRNCKISAVLMSLLIAAAGYNADLKEWFYGFIALSHMWMIRQINVVDLDNSNSCLKFFKRSVPYGTLVLAGIIAGKDLTFKTDVAS
ncbi:prenyltransferase, UbiA family protein, putative [Babesia bigemina]|uniref:Prenyltransferase, UbiA family protein, putative n=1 Tax=Babesia bigemina TaxID=5866 RepID=A0A061DBI6_BABBI|nr:prenyltransferase, UbiA family protein, putative [Babesia bigemina]CDR96264.1 prenyltransferase, UbiA family protein, putative [Babesia bigemina]|eukprot:XP_012768450.1 prenyltransferase, UbiA family protein, putative [Babesia bigemina]